MCNVIGCFNLKTESLLYVIDDQWCVCNVIGCSNLKTEGLLHVIDDQWCVCNVIRLFPSEDRKLVLSLSWCYQRDRQLEFMLLDFSHITIIAYFISVHDLCLALIACFLLFFLLDVCTTYFLMFDFSLLMLLHVFIAIYCLLVLFCASCM